MSVLGNDMLMVQSKIYFFSKTFEADIYISKRE